MQPLASPQLVEQYILESNDPTNIYAQKQATAWLQEWTKQVTATRTLQTLVEKSPHEQVQFFALATLGRRNLTDAERSHLRGVLIIQFHATAAFLRNKVAWILARFVWQDVPLHWTTFEHDMLHHLAVRQPATFLKTIETVLEEFNSVTELQYLPQREHDGGNGEFSSASSSSFASKESMRRVKDFFKGYITTTGTVTGRHEHVQAGSSCLLELMFDRTIGILEYSLTSDADWATTMLALQTVQQFFLWMDVTSISVDARTLNTATPKALLLLLHLVSSTKYPADIQVGTFKAWQEWSASANPNAYDPTYNRQYKFPIIRQVMQCIHTCNLLPYQGESNAPIEVVIEAAKFVNTSGFEILSEWEMAPSQYETVWLEVVDLFFRAFAYDDIDVSSAVLPLATRLVASFGESDSKVTTGKGSERPREFYLGQLLNLLYQQMHLPIDFSYDHDDEDDAEEFLYRTELAKLFTRLVRVASQICLQFVRHIAERLGCNLAEAPTPTLIAFLRLVYHYCEGIRPPPGLKTLMSSSNEFCSLIAAIHESNIIEHSHHEVICLYYEIAARYYPIFQPGKNCGNADSLQLLSRVLNALSGARGLQHEHSLVRSRCCYLLLRLVKSVVTLLRPFVKTAVTGIYSLLANSSSGESLRPEDTMYLFETMGLLLGKTGLPPLEQHEYLVQLISPHVRSVEERLRSARSKDELFGQEDELAGCLSAISYVSKGFSPHSPDSVKMVLVDTMNIVLNVLKALPESELIRNKTLAMLQRFIICTGESVLLKAHSVLIVIIEYCSEEDICFASQLMNQLCLKFKRKAIPALDRTLLPFLRKCDRLVMDTVKTEGLQVGKSISWHGLENPLHLRLEQLSVQKCAFSVLQHVVSNGAFELLISESNVDSFPSILQFMCEGAVYVNEPPVRRACVRFFLELINAWAETALELAHRGHQMILISFCSEHLAPGMFSLFFDSSFDEMDALNVRIIQDFGQILFGIIMSIRGKDQEVLRLIDSSASAIDHAIGRCVPRSSINDALSGAPNASDLQSWLKDLLRCHKRNDPTYEVIC